MNVDQLTKELAESQTRMATLMAQMDSIYNELQKAMPAAAASWMAKEVESKIKENPNVVQSLGMEKLSVLKAKLKTLTENLPALVESQFQDRAKWPHYDKFFQSHKAFQTEPHINQIFRNAISTLGPLLNEYGLLADPHGYKTWKHEGSSFRYAINPGVSTLPESKIAEYWQSIREYETLVGKSKELQKKIDEAKAMDLWNKA